MEFIKDSEIIDILWKSIKKETLSDEELTTLNAWLSRSGHNRELLAKVTDEKKLGVELEFLLNRDSETTWNRILLAIETKVVRMKFWRKSIVAAAILIVALAGGTLFYLSRPSQKEKDIALEIAKLKSADAVIRNAAFTGDGSPAVPGALLTLLDGTVVDLGKTDGPINIKTKNGISKLINNLQDGELVFDADARHLSDEQARITLNTLSLSTLRGRYYRVVLPDGSKIKLNAASTLRFPIAFSSKERRVAITGEAYFEVSPVSSFSPQSPFFINANDVDIEVLGTSFNLNAYPDEEDVTTTLVRGAVVIKKGDSVCQLKSGEQAKVSNSNELPVKPIRHSAVSEKELSAATAWNNDDKFTFNKSTVNEVMRQISRWYNMEVVFKSRQSHDFFSGSISRKLNISGTIHILQSNGINARLEGTKIVVY